MKGKIIKWAIRIIAAGVLFYFAVLLYRNACTFIVHLYGRMS